MTITVIIVESWVTLTVCVPPLSVEIYSPLPLPRYHHSYPHHSIHLCHIWRLCVYTCQGRDENNALQRYQYESSSFLRNSPYLLSTSYACTERRGVCIHTQLQFANGRLSRNFYANLSISQKSYPAKIWSYTV